jgi:hypothetical protein
LETEWFPKRSEASSEILAGSAFATLKRRLRRDTVRT